MEKKGQAFHTYTEELKREVACLKLEEGWSYPSAILYQKRCGNSEMGKEFSCAEQVFLVRLKQLGKLM